MDNVIKLNSRRRMKPLEHCNGDYHKGWPSHTGAHTYLGTDGHDGTRRLAEREFANARHEVVDKFVQREKIRSSLRVVESDIDRNR